MKVRSECLAAALALLACGPSGQSSTGVGNPSASFSLLVLNDEDDVENAGGASNVAGAPNDASAGEANGGGAPNTDAEAPLARGQIRNALLSLGLLEFLPCDESLPHPKLVGPFVIDLVSKRPLSALPRVPRVAGGYCGIDAPLAPARQQATLVGRSLFFDGVRADGTRFLVYANMQATLRLRVTNGVPVTEETPNLIWGLRPRRWLSLAEVDAAEPELFDGARTIVIDVNRHPLLYMKIQARLGGRSALYPDLNDNGVIDADERAHALMVGDENAD